MNPLFMLLSKKYKNLIKNINTYYLLKQKKLNFSNIQGGPKKVYVIKRKSV
jgi:hypothetical protein